MVSIGGDRATNADYKRANKEAQKRARSKPKSEPKERKADVGRKVLGGGRRVPEERVQQRQPQYNQPKYQVPKGLRGGPPVEPYRAEPGPIKKEGPNFWGGGQNTSAPLRWGTMAEGGGQKPAGLTGPGVGQTTVSDQPGRAPAVPAPAETHTPVPPVSDGVREILNKRHWKTPKKGKTAEMPKSSFEKGSVKDLVEHDYRMSDEEWNRIQDTYNSPEARAAGFIPPTADAADTDKTVPLVELDDQESVALTWEAYEKLNDGQRAAVDFNTLLVTAREKDLSKKKINITAADKAKYDSQVLAMFGAGRGSDVTAINTVKLLNDLDMTQVGQDLDEYLSLERGFDTTELPDFKFSKGQLHTLEALTNGQTQTPAQAEQAYAAVRTPGNMAALDTANVMGAEAAIKEAMAKKDVNTYNFDTLMYGTKAGPKPGTEATIGYGVKGTQWDNPTNAGMDEWFRLGLEVLGAQDTTEYGVPKDQDVMSGLLAALPSVSGYNKNTKQQFLDYVQNYAQMTGQYGTPEEATQAALITKRAGMGG